MNEQNQMIDGKVFLKMNVEDRLMAMGYEKNSNLTSRIEQQDRMIKE